MSSVCRRPHIRLQRATADKLRDYSSPPVTTPEPVSSGCFPSTQTILRRAYSGQDWTSQRRPLSPRESTSHEFARKRSTVSSHVLNAPKRAAKTLYRSTTSKKSWRGGYEIRTTQDPRRKGEGDRALQIRGQGSSVPRPQASRDCDRGRIAIVRPCEADDATVHQGPRSRNSGGTEPSSIRNPLQGAIAP
jgi:hypothetical protein